MPRAVHNQGFPARNRFSSKTTPYSVMLSIPIFILFSLIFRNAFTLLLQALFIVMALLVCGFSLRGLRILPLIPLLLFIVAVNTFRGGGEILYRAGPFIIMKQGVGRGLYYAVFVLELVAMSTMLTRSFSEEQLVSVFRSVGRLFSRKSHEKAADHFSFTLMLFCILRTFHAAYAELRVFFRKSPLSFRQRTLLFVKKLFQQVMRDYEKTHGFYPETIKPRIGDMAVVICQLCILIAAILLVRGVSGFTRWPYTPG